MSASTIGPEGPSRPWEQTPQRRPVVPPWMADRKTRAHAARWAGRHAAHHLAFHGLRLPKYTLRTAACAPRGLAVGTWHLWRWLFDRDDAGTHELRIDAAARRDHKAYATAARIRRDRVRTRLLGCTVSAVLVAVLALIVHLAWPPGTWLLLAGAIGVLGYIGRPQRR